MSKPTKVCIFCQIKRDISKEHIIPKWAGYLFDDLGIAQTFVEFDADGDRSFRRRRQGPPAKLQVRAVCMVCNSGWMKSHEEACRPFLEKLATSATIEIGVEDQAALARWVCMKLMVAERSRIETALFKQADRTALMNEGAIPPGLNIMFFQCLAHAFQSIYAKDSAHSSPTPQISEDKFPRPNIGTWVLGFRNLLIFAVYAEPGITMKLNFDEWPGRAIHPGLGSPFIWPPAIHLSESAARHLSSLLRITAGGPRFEIPPLPRA